MFNWRIQAADNDRRLILPLTFFVILQQSDSLGAAGGLHHVRNSLMFPVTRDAAARHRLRARGYVSLQHIKSDTQQASDAK